MYSNEYEIYANANVCKCRVVHVCTISAVEMAFEYHVMSSASACHLPQTRARSWLGLYSIKSLPDSISFSLHLLVFFKCVRTVAHRLLCCRCLAAAALLVCS